MTAAVEVSPPELSVYGQRALQEYEKLAAEHNVDVGHCSNHVLKVTRDALTALQEVPHNRNDELLVEVSCILHEYVDSKLWKRTLSEEEAKSTLSEILERVFSGEAAYKPEEFYNMIDYCSTSKWGDRIPSGATTIQLIPRWADRAEAVGVIGVARVILYGFSVRSKTPLCRNEADFPTTMEELDHVAPPSRFEEYTRGKKSLSAFEHFLDKIVHISVGSCEVEYFRKVFEEGQLLTKQYVLDFTNIHGKRFDIDWILERLDTKLYSKEAAALKEIQGVLRNEGNPWIV